MGGFLGCPDDPGCRECKSRPSRHCVQCTNGIAAYLTGQCKALEPGLEIPGCERYITFMFNRVEKHICVECKLGMGMHRDRCVPCVIRGCAQCDQFDFCTACFGSVRLEGKGRQAKCTDDKVEFPNCQAVEFGFDDQPRGCVQCNPGFIRRTLKTTVASFDCVPESIPNCEVMEFKVKKGCMRCQKGFYITRKGTCLRPEDAKLMDAEPEPDTEGPKDTEESEEEVPVREGLILWRTPGFYVVLFVILCFGVWVLCQPSQPVEASKPLENIATGQ